MFLHILASDSLKSRSTSKRTSGFIARSRLGQRAVEVCLFKNLFALSITVGVLQYQIRADASAR